MERFKEQENWLVLDSGQQVNLSQMGDLEFAGLVEYYRGQQAQANYRIGIVNREIEARNRTNQETLDFYGDQPEVQEVLGEPYERI